MNQRTGRTLTARGLALFVAAALVVIALLACLGCNSREALGEMFQRIAAEHDAEADEWQAKIDDFAGIPAGWGGGLGHELAAIMVEQNRETAARIRAALPGNDIVPPEPDPAEVSIECQKPQGLTHTEPAAERSVLVEK